MRQLSGLAPGEVYLAETFTRLAGGLLHHRFTLTDNSAVYFLLHFLAGYPEWVLPTTMLFGARTFLDISAAIAWSTHPKPAYRLVKWLVELIVTTSAASRFQNRAMLIDVGATRMRQ